MDPSAFGPLLQPRKENALRQILADHVARYPQLEAQDLYKLVYQGVMGCEHAVVDASRVRELLDMEMAALAEGPFEPAVDPISADGRLVRVHLRPFAASAGDTSLLATAFIRTAHEHRGTVEELRGYWSLVERLAVGRVDIRRRELRDFFAETESRGFPPVHHSEAYVAAYKPAYRVIRREFLPRQGSTSGEMQATAHGR